MLARVGYLLLDPASGLAVFWPPAGLYLAALVIEPRRRWPGIVAAVLPAAVLGSVLAGRSLEVALWLFAGNTVEAIMGASLVVRLGGPRPGVSSVREALALVALPAAAGALVAPLTFAAQSIVHGGSARANWIFWAGTSLGILVVAPLVVAWHRAEAAPRGPARPIEVLGLATAATLSLAAASGTFGPPWLQQSALLPPVLWAALRFGPRAATVTSAILAFALARALASHPAAAIAAEGIRASQLHLAVVLAAGLLVAASDEERRLAARALARSRDLLQSFFASAPVGVFVKDEERRGIFYSRWMEELVGSPSDALLGRTVTEIIPGPAGEKLFELEGEAIATGRNVRLELPFGERSYLAELFPIPRAGGTPYVGGFVLDVTDRLRAETALRESEARLRLVEAALDHASDAVCVHDEEGRCVWANAAMARALGRTKEALLGATFSELRPGVDPATWRARWDETAAKGALVREEPIPAQGGRTVPGEVASSIVSYAGRRYLVSSARDVSDRRQAEASARLAGLGTVAAGVAHEINNPLSYVLSNLAWLQERIEAARPEDLGASIEEARQVLAEARDGAQRVRDIVAQLRAFSRPQERTGPVDVGAAARSALAIVQNDVRHRAQLVTRFEDVPPVAGNETRLAQVVLNLLANAAQAIPPGRADRNVILLAVRPGERADEVVIEVADSGPGIPYGARGKLFEPFYSTKPVGSGTGLGLFICHRIVAEMGGRIELESAPGAGATFRVLLPAAPPAPSAAPTPAPAAAKAASRRARLLVLDDDERVAHALRRILERDHDVEVLGDAARALERAREGASWDVVFCDLMMPDMTGMEWFEEVARVRPDLSPRIVFVTGGAFTDAARDFLDRVPNARLDKPFVADEVRALVAERVP